MHAGARRGRMQDWLAEARHSGHNFFWMSQYPQQVDKIIVNLTNEFVTLENRSQQQWGWFRAPAGFVWRRYVHVPMRANSEPMCKGRFNIQVKGLANCYNTASGDDEDSLHLADKGQHRRGLPWQIVPIFALAVLVVFVVGLHSLGWEMQHFMQGVNKVATQGVSRAAGIARNTNAPGSVPGRVGPVSGAGGWSGSSGGGSVTGQAASDAGGVHVTLGQSVGVHPSARVWCVGWQSVNGVREFILSNGRRYKAAPGGAVRGWNEDGVIIEDTFYAFDNGQHEEAAPAYPAETFDFRRSGRQ